MLPGLAEVVALLARGTPVDSPNEDHETALNGAIQLATGCMTVKWDEHRARAGLLVVATLIKHGAELKRARAAPHLHYRSFPSGLTPVEYWLKTGTRRSAPADA